MLQLLILYLVVAFKRKGAIKLKGGNSTRIWQAARDQSSSRLRTTSISKYKMINAHCGFGTSGNPQVYDMNLCLSLLCYIFFSRHNKIIEAVTPNTGVESKTLENQTPKTSKQANNFTEPEPMPTCSWKAKLKNDFNAMPIQIMTSSTFSLQWLCLCCQCPCGRCCSSAGGGGGIVVFVVLVLLPVMVLVVLVLVLVLVVVLVVAAPIFAVTELTPPSSPEHEKQVLLEGVIRMLPCSMMYMRDLASIPMTWYELVTAAGLTMTRHLWFNLYNMPYK